MARERFDHKAIEQAAQEKWEATGIYATDLTDSSKDPYYLLFEFPYPSGDLHIGHWYAYAVTDIYARTLRMQGKNVLFPVGFDAFGLPAENAAMKQGADPKEWTLANMEKMRSQMKSIGTSVDWSKEIVTCDPSYYKWTQWLFAKLYEQGLAERRNAPVKWCPKDQTVLANEQVVDGACERCGTEVVEKNLTQWFMKITSYAERLLADLETLPWREDIKEAQKAWIGKSEGAKLFFTLTGSEERIEVFTTRPDTVFGATYVVLAPEHPLIDALIERAGNAAEIAAYRDATKKKTERERSENKEKTGVEIAGVKAINPATKAEIPVYVADYVLGSYGTGAVMAVPAHDERDYAFARKHSLPVRYVIAEHTTDNPTPPVEGKRTVERDNVMAIVRNPKDGTVLLLRWKQQPWHTFINGGVEAGESLEASAMREIAEETGYTNVRFIEELGSHIHSEFYAVHKNENRYAKIRCLLFELVDDTHIESEVSDVHEPMWAPEAQVMGLLAGADPKMFWQRYLSNKRVYDGDGVLVDSGEFSGRTNREAMWDIVSFVGGERTTNYRIRDWLVSRQRYWGCPIPVVYDPDGKAHLVPEEHMPWLLPEDVDFTPNGAAPLASSKELKERVTRIFGEGWTPEYDTLDTFVDSSWYFLRYVDHADEHNFSDMALLKKWLPVDRYSGGSEHTTMHLLYARFFHKALYDLALVPTLEPFNERYNRGLIMGPDGQKMSKRWGNVVNPDDMRAAYGADAVRMYLAFLGPYSEPGHYPWKPEGVEAMRKLLDRIYALKDSVGEGEVSEELQRSFAKAAAKMKEDADRFKFNTALAAFMVLIKDVEALAVVPAAAYRDLLRLIAPYAPHLAEHLWEGAGGEGSIHLSDFPHGNPTLLQDELVPVIVQVNGKRKGELMLAPNAPESEAREAALMLAGVEAERVIYVPGRIVNLVLAKK